MEPLNHVIFFVRVCWSVICRACWGAHCCVEMSTSYFTLVFSSVTKEHKQGQRCEKTATPGTQPGEKDKAWLLRPGSVRGLSLAQALFLREYQGPTQTDSER